MTLSVKRRDNVTTFHVPVNEFKISARATNHGNVASVFPSVLKQTNFSNSHVFMHYNHELYSRPHQFDFLVFGF